MVSSEDWAYLAGLIDGEGTVALYSNPHGGSSNCYVTVVRISNTNLDLIDWIVERFGARVVEYNRERSSSFGHKRLYRAEWASASDVGTILQGVMPYLVAKKRFAEMLMSFITVPKWEKEMREIVLNNFKEIR